MPTTLYRSMDNRSRSHRPAVATAEDREALIEGLNRDLAGEFQAVVMYMLYSSKLTGPFRRELRSLFQAEVLDELSHAQYLCDKIASLSGEPTTEFGTIVHTGEPVEMLRHALAAEICAISEYTARARQAELCGELGLKVTLENQIADETRHRDELELILAGWPTTMATPASIRRWQDDGGRRAEIDSEIAAV